MSKVSEIVALRLRALSKLEKGLKKLDLSWKVIETTARVVSPPESAGFIGTLEHTRLAFSHLAAEMVEQIAQTHLTNCQRDLEAKAQVAIDILVRNLFERTADVGFIATDGPLVNYVQQEDLAQRDGLLDRLREYRDKYTVYDDILLLDRSARLLLSLQARTARSAAAPSWWQQALSRSGYVEHYGPSTLFPADGSALLYAHRIVGSGESVCGVVVLRFDLQSELQSIFRQLATARTSVLLLDAHGRVVASSQPERFKPMDTLPLTGAGTVLTIEGVEYIFAHCATRGYQGYMGPGWTAVALVRLDEAFDQVPGEAASTAPADGSGAAEVAIDNPALQAIIARARGIEEDLNRVIWNGKLAESGALTGSALGPVFAEIGRASKQTISMFDSAIRDMKNLLAQGQGAELLSHAALAVDIMDRNLYERANDCRWWALSEELADLLLAMESATSAGASARAAEILAHLNSLYTVYRRVALFDRRGRVLAVSRDPQTLPGALTLAPELVQRTLALTATQQYCVSDMEPHALADGAATYLYCAPIRKPGSVQALGGIALAFNCADELQAMLNDALPPGGTASALFVRADGRVLASTRSDIAVAAAPDFLPQLLALQQGTSICQWGDQLYLAGLARSKGYREFKVSDGYRDEVYAVLLSPLDPLAQASAMHALPHRQGLARDAANFYGVVQCGRLLFGLGSQHVIEAVTARHMGAAPVASQASGLLEYTRGAAREIVPVYDACALTGQGAMADPADAVAIVVRGQGRTIALLVDKLIDVIENDALGEPPGGLNPNAPWINGYIHDGRSESVPIFTLNPQALQLA